MPDHVEDELAKLRERIAEQRRLAEQPDGPPTVVVTHDGARVAFSVPDDLDE